MMRSLGRIVARNHVKKREEERTVLYFASWGSEIQKMTRIQVVASDVHIMGF